ncbi:MAG: potassium transporter TrkA [Chloroflexi bacterium HGW-Chloroflexi-1]|nr:MAG: potassium transporter TrkA [Chloroflexi bacterium HGW-Chloroflexi-1]
MKIIIVGCGRIGSALALRLSTQGHTVSVVDPQREAFNRLGENFRGRMIDGVGFDRNTLLRAGIETADALAAVTPDDSSNVIIARIARNRFKVRRVVARLYDQHHANQYQVLGIQTASTAAWGVDRLEQMLCAPDLAEAVTIGSGGVEIVDLHLPPALDGQPIEHLQTLGELIVVALTRGGVTTLPKPGMRLQIGDLLHLGVPRGTLSHLREALDHAGKEVVA